MRKVEGRGHFILLNDLNGESQRAANTSSTFLFVPT